MNYTIEHEGVVAIPPGAVTGSSVYNLSLLLFDTYGEFGDREEVRNGLFKAIEKRGRCRPSKAVASYIYKEFGLKLSPQVLERVGQLMRFVDWGEIDLRFTLGADGTQDEYANNNSCWWTQFWKARDILLASGGGAARVYPHGVFYNEDNLMGRAWFLPYSGTELKNGYVFFNFYGRGDWQHADTWAGVLSKVFDREWAPVIISSENTDVFFNDATAIFVGDVLKQPNKRYKIEPVLLYPETWVYETECSQCNRHFRAEEMTEVYGGESVCPSCIRECYRLATAGSAAGYYIPRYDAVAVRGEVYHTGDIAVNYINNVAYPAEETLELQNRGYYVLLEDQGVTWDYCSRAMRDGRKEAYYLRDMVCVNGEYIALRNMSEDEIATHIPALAVLQFDEVIAALRRDHMMAIYYEEGGSYDFLP